MSECSLDSRKMLSRCPASRHEPNSNLITRSNGRRDMLGDGGLGDGILGDGGAPSVQHGFAQPLGIAFAGFRKIDYLLRDDIVGNVAAINKPKRYPCHFISKTHEPHGLRVESLAI